MFLPMPLLRALPGPPGGGDGRRRRRGLDVPGERDPRRRRPFITSMFNYAGGVGARATSRGCATAYPTGVAAVPIEVVESSAPLGSCARSCARVGWSGFRGGGLGQVIEFTVDNEPPWTLNAVTSRLAHPPRACSAAAPARPVVPGQRGAGPHPKAHRAALGRPRTPRAARWRRLRRRERVRPRDDRRRSPDAGASRRRVSRRHLPRVRRRRGDVTTWTYGEFDTLVARVAGGLAPTWCRARVVRCTSCSPTPRRSSQPGSRPPSSVPGSSERPAVDRTQLAGHVSRTSPAIGVCGADRAATSTPAPVGTNSSTVDEADSALAALCGTPSIGATPRPARDRAAVMFTSGTTSAPKGVVVTQAN